jgi:two-component system OmpR family response regulator
MNSDKRIKIFLVDDDALYLKSLEIEFHQSGSFEIETYPTGEECIKNLNHDPAIIILDYHLDGIEKSAMNGIETLDKIKASFPDLPVIMLSSQDKIEVAIDCMHHKAFDYVVKSETAFLRIEKAIRTIQDMSKLQMQVQWYMDRM